MIFFIYKVKFYQKYNNSYKLWKTKYLTKGENYSKEAALSLYKELLIDVGNQVDKNS